MSCGNKIVQIVQIFLRYIVRKKCQKRTFPTPLPTINISTDRKAQADAAKIQYRHDPGSIDPMENFDWA